MLFIGSAAAACLTPVCMEDQSDSEVQLSDKIRLESDTTWCAYSQTGEQLDSILTQYCPPQGCKDNSRFWLYQESAFIEPVELELKYYKQKDSPLNTTVQHGVALENAPGVASCQNILSQKKLHLSVTPSNTISAGVYRTGLVIRNITKSYDYLDTYLDVVLSVQPSVKISGLQDVLFNFSELGTGDPDWYFNDQSICIYSNTTYNGYNLSVSGNQPGALMLRNSLSNISIPYRIYLEPPNNSWLIINESGDYGPLYGSGRIDCSDDGFTRLRIDMQKQHVRESPVDIYTDTITITVTPD